MAEQSYDDLLAERRKEWNQAQVKAAADLKAQHAALAKMPDVAAPPDKGLPWGSPGIVCARDACLSAAFQVTRWVTVNGVRHRAELKCLGCGKLGTWDWGDGAWID